MTKHTYTHTCFTWPFLLLTFSSTQSVKGILFFETLHSDGYLFPFLLCLSLLFSQLFVRPSQTTFYLYDFPFLGDVFDHHLLYNVMNLHA